MIPARLTVCLLVAVVLVSELMPTTDANLATIQASWKAMKRRMRQKRRMMMPNLVKVRKLRKRVTSGDRRLSCVRYDYLGRCTRYRVMFLWG
eukprot:Seg4019.2 transcript_id=Seg4019.2/GoldUCD/mRNA.D3Y31 product="hypothetical protein" protein_id=Seg4019.2/GoldUCD/D3Y31